MDIMKGYEPGVDEMVHEVCRCPEFKGGDIGPYKDTNLIVFRDGTGKIISFGQDGGWLLCIKKAYKALMKRRAAY